MNKIFKVIWSKSKQCYVVVSEMAKNTTGKKKIIVASILVALSMQSTIVLAANESGTVKGGTQDNVAIGRLSYSNSNQSIAIGYQSKASGTFIGGNIQPSIALGAGAKAEGNNTISIGTSSSNVASYALALGNGSNIASGADYGIAAGYKTSVSAQQGIAIGTQTTATASLAMAIGNNASASGENAIAVGKSTIASDGDAVSIGTSSQATGGDSIALGKSAKATSGDAIAIGQDSEANNLNAVALGKTSKATGASATALGPQSTASATFATAIGMSSVANQEYAIAIGGGSQATVQRGVALGTYSVADTASGVTGYDANANRTNKYAGLTGKALRSSWGAVSIGDGTNTRQITGLAAGTKDTDAVNVAQLKSVNLAFTGDNNSSGDVNLVNSKLAITGDNTYITTAAANQGLTIKAKKETITVSDGSASANIGVADARNVADAINQANAEQKISYKANNDTAKSVKLSDGLKFTDGTSTVATVGNNGQVTYDLNGAIKKSISDSEAAVKRHISLGADSGTASSQSLSSNHVDFNVKGGNGSFISTSMSGNTVLVNTTRGTIQSDSAGNASLSGNDGLATAQNVATAINQAKAGAAWKLSANNGGAETISGGDTVDFANGNNIEVSRSSKKITIKTKDDMTVNSLKANNSLRVGNDTTIDSSGIQSNSVKTGNTTMNTSGLTISGGPSVTTAGINAGNKAITSVGSGLGNDSNAATVGDVKSLVNGLGSNSFKLMADSTSTTAQALNKSGGLSFKVAGDSDLISTSATGDTVKVSISKGSLTNNTDGTVNANKAGVATTGDVATAVNDAVAKATGAQGLTITDGTHNGKINLKTQSLAITGTNGVDATVNNQNLTVGLNTATKTAIDNAQTAVNRTISLGADSGTASNQSLKDGNVAFNVKGKTGDYITTAMNGSTVEIATTRATIDSNASTGAASVTGADGLVTAKNVSDAINKAAEAAKSGAAWNLTTNSSASNKTLVQGGDTVDLVNGDNIEISQDGTDKKKVTIKTKKDLTVDSIVTNKSVTVGSGANQISLNGTNGAIQGNTFAGNSFTAGNSVLNTTGFHITGGPSVTAAGIDAGNKAITNVASGLGNDSNAATVGDVKGLVDGVGKNTFTLAADTTSTTAQALNKSGGLSFKVAGDSDLISTSATGNTVTVSISKGSLTNNTDGTVNANTAGVATTGDVATAVNDAVAKATGSQGLTITDGANTGKVNLKTQSLNITGTNGVDATVNNQTVTVGLNTATKTAIDNAQTAVNRTISLGADSGTVSSQSLKDGNVAFNVKGKTGDYITTAMNGNTVEVSTQQATLSNNATTGAATVTGNDGLVTAKNVADTINAVADKIKTSAAWKLTTNSSATDVTDVKSGDTVDFVNGDNIEISQDGTNKKKVTIKTKKDLTVDSVAANKSVTIGSGTNQINLDGTTGAVSGNTFAGNSFTAGNSVLNTTGFHITGGPSVTATGIDAGNKAITNVASGGTTRSNAATVGDVQDAVANLSQNLNITDGTNNGTVDLKTQKLNVAGANGVTATVNNQTITVGLDTNVVNATTKGIGLTGDTGTTGNKYLKDGDVSFAVTGDSNLVSTKATTAGVQVSVDASKIKDLAVGAVTVSKDATQTDNPITVSATTGTNAKDYAIGIDTAKLATKTELTYRANNDTDANAKKVSLAKGLNFVNGTGTEATVGTNGTVSFGLDTATKTAIDNAQTAVNRTISLGADSGTVSSQSLKDGNVAFDVKGTTGDYITTAMNGSTVEISTQRATITSNATTGEAAVTGDGLVTAKNVVDAINTAADRAKANAAWKLTTNSSTTDITDVKSGDTVDLVNGDNIEISQDGTNKKKVTIKTKKDLTVDSIVANKSVTVGSGTNQINLDGTTGAVSGNTFAGNSFTAGNSVLNTTGFHITGGPSVTATGIDAGNKAITNVASGGTTRSNAATVGDVQDAVANLSQNLNITDGTNNGTVDLKTQKLNVAGANGVTATVNNQTITVGLDTNVVNATTKGIGLTGDTGTTGNKYLKDGDVSFAVTGDSNLVSTKATAAGVQVSVDASKIKDLAVGAVTVSKDATQTDNPITVSATTGTNAKDYAIGIDTAKLATKTELTYRANNDTDANAKKVSLAKGLNFVNGTGTEATVGTNGTVSFGLDTATKTAIDNAQTAVNRTISLGADSGTVSSQSLKDGNVAFDVKGTTGDYITTAMNGSTVEISTQRATITSNATTGEAAVTGDGLVTAKNVVDAINTAADRAKANAAWKLTTNSSTTDITDVKSGDTVDLVNGDNIEISQDGTNKKKVTIKTKKDLTVDSIVANKSVTVGSGTNQISLDGTTGAVSGNTFAGNSFTAGNSVLNTTGFHITGGPSVTAAGIDAGNKAITNLASGLGNDSNAATVGDVKGLVDGVGNNTFTLTADTTSTTAQALNKSGGLSFKVAGDSDLISTSATGNTVTVSISKGSLTNNTDGTVNANKAGVATTGDVATAVNTAVAKATGAQELTITDGTTDGTINLKNQKLNVAGANGVTTTVNNQTITVGLDTNVVNATTKGIGLTGDTGATGNKYLKDGDVSFAVTGDSNLVSTKATTAGVQVSVDASKIKDLAVGAVTVSKDATQTDNPITVSATTGTNAKDYAIGIDTAKLATKTELTYRANNDTDANAKKVSLAKGLNFVNGTGTEATVGTNGTVSFGLDTATKTAIDNAQTAVNRTISLGADSGTVSSQSLKDGNVAFDVKGTTGDYITTAMNGSTVEISTQRATITSNATTGEAAVTGDGLVTAKNVVDAINTAADRAKANAAWKLTTNSSTTDITDVKSGDTVDLVNGDNIEISQDGTNKKKVTIKTKKDLTVDSIVANKSVTVGSGANQISLDGTTGAVSGNTFAGNSFTAGNSVLNTTGFHITGGPSVTATGIDAGNKAITNVASGGTTRSNAATVGDVQDAVANLSQNLNITDGTNNGTVDLKTQKLNVAGANGVTATVNNQTITVGLDTNVVNATTKGIGLTGDTGATGNKYLKDGDVSFAVTGDSNLVSTKATTAGVQVSVDASKIKDLAVGAVTVSKDATQTDNPITVSATTGTNAKDYAIGIDTAKLATKTELTYRANNDTDANAKKVSLAKGLNFVNGTGTEATVGTNGTVSFGLDTATKTAIDNAQTAVNRTISLGADSGTVSSQSLKDGNVAFDVKGTTGDYITTAMNGSTVEISTQRATITSNATTGEAAVTGDGLVTAKNVVDAINTAADRAKANAAWKLTTNSSTTDITDVKSGDTVDLVNGDNIEISQDGTNKKKVTIKTKKDLTVDSIVANKSVTVGSGTNQINLDGTTGAVSGNTFAGNSFTAGNSVLNTTGFHITGGPSVTATGIDAGNKAITNVASGGTTRSNAATVGDVQDAVANLSQNLNITDGTNNGTVDLKTQKLNVAGANGVTATVNNQTITVGLDTNVVNATTKGIGLTGDTGTTGNKYLKDGDVSFAVTGDSNLVSTKATAAGVQVSVDASKIKDLAVGAVTVSKDATQTDNPITVSATTGTNAKDYAIGIDTAKLATKTELTYRANNDTDANAKKVSLAKGLNFVNGTGTEATVGTNGTVSFGLDTATKTAIDNAQTAVNRTISLGADSGTVSSQSLKDGNVAFDVKGTTGDYITTAMNGSTVEISTTRATINSNATTGAASVTGADGLVTAKNVSDAINKAAEAAKSGAAWNLTTNSSTTDTTLVQGGDTVDLVNGDNIEISQDSTNKKKVTIKTKKDLTVDSIVANKSVTVGSGTNQINLDGTTGAVSGNTFAGNSFTAGNSVLNTTGFHITGGPSVTATGIDAGNKAITNVASGGTTRSNAATVGDVQDAVANSGWKVTVGTDGSGQSNVTGTSPEKIKADEIVTFKAGNNMIVTQAGKTISYAVNPVLSGMTSATFTDPVGTTITNGNGITIAPAGGAPSVSLTKDGLDNGGNKITNVAPGQGPKDAVNMSQLQGIGNSQAAAINQVAAEVERVGAHAAAMAALKPIQYDPLEPTQFMAGVGNYRGQTAAAIGLAHYTNENTMFNVGVSVGGNHNMVNAGVTHKFGISAEKKNIPDRYKAGPISSIYVMQDEMTQLRSENEAYKAKLDKQQSEIDALKAAVDQLLASKA